MRRPSVVLLAAFASGCPSRENAPPSRSLGVLPSVSAEASSSTKPSSVIAPPEVAAGTVRRLAPGEHAPLRGYRVDAKEGDFVLSNAGRVAIVSASTGRLLDFGAIDGQDEIVAIEPALSLEADGAKGARLELEGIETEGPSVLAAVWRAAGTSLTVHVFYTFEDAALRIESLVVSRGDVASIARLGESIAWGNVPTWVEGHGFVGAAGVFAGSFVGRDALGVAYALGRAQLTDAHFAVPSPGFWSGPRTGDDAGPVAAWGSSRRRVAWLTCSARSIGDAALALPKWKSVPVKLPASAFGDALSARAIRYDVETHHCGGEPGKAGAPFAPFRVSPRDPDFALPSECFVARFAAPGHASGPWVTPAELGTDLRRDTPRAGKLRWMITERGRGAIPARIVVRGVSPTPDPSWGDDPTFGATLNVVYTDRAGERALAPGRYMLTITRGFEYTSREIDVLVEADKTATVSAELERVVDTRGWISADLHLHAVPSPDAPSLLTDRIRSLVAGGVEVGVATDHNVITDYAPTIRQLGLDRWVTSIIGDEITTKGTLYGHFNLFPLVPGAPIVAFENTTPHAIIEASRAAAPAQRDKVLQLNHPRMGDIGYFDIVGFDPKDVAGWQKRTPLAELGFDAIEVFNGDHYAELDQVERCMRDWYALLDAGKRVTATGNSDSHKLAYHEAGVPLNYVQIANDDPAKLDERAFVDAVRKGRVVVSSGPFVRVTANRKEIGDTVTAGDLDVAVRVDAPPWVDVDRVELVGRGGAILQTFSVKPSTKITRIDAHTKLALKHGDWVIAIARGTKPMTFLHRAGAKPFAFTNPIFID